MLKWLGLSALIVVLDQIAKLVMTRIFTLHESVEVTPFFNLVLVHNRGAAFSFLSDAGGWQRELFIFIALAAAAWIAWLLRRHSGETRFCLALSLILGGAIGNVIDRVIYGAVTDFLVFDLGFWPLNPWPAFNIADAALVVGVALMAIDMTRPPKTEPTGPAGEASTQP